MKFKLYFSIVLVVFIFGLTHQTLKAQLCQLNSNLMIYSNYDGGAITINVDVNIPNLKIGVSSYEASQITITGPFAANVTQVIYSGFNANSNNCNLGIITTSISGVSPSITAINVYPAVGSYTPVHGFGNSQGIIGCYQCDTITSSGGVNSPDEIVFHFKQLTGGLLRAHHTQYGCWTNTTFNVSSLGNCCILPAAPSPCPTPPAPTNISSAASLTTCVGKASTLTVNAPNASLNWYAIGGSTASIGTNANLATPTFTVPGLYSYFAIATNSCGNSPNTNITVSVNPLPAVQLSLSSNTICANGGAPINLTGIPPGGVYSGANVSGSQFITNFIPGVYTPVYSYTNPSTGCSRTATASIISTICFELPSLTLAKNTVVLYPNPSSGIYTLIGLSSGPTQLEVYDLTGRLVKKTTLTNALPQLDCTALESGIYNCVILQEGQRQHQLLIKE